MRVSRKESLGNAFSSSEFRDYLVKHVLEIVNLTKDYGGLARNSEDENALPRDSLLLTLTTLPSKMIVIN